MHTTSSTGRRDMKRRPSEMGRALKMLGGLPTAIMKYPSGRYGLVGRIPMELTEPVLRGTPQIPPLRGSKAWDTESDVIAALLALGITKFQKADCSWYQGA